ncbi:MAG: PepSY domain-containing protein [Neisseria sp.]|nr:PepSY domain-containing protein [Neisseria sp.]
MKKLFVAALIALSAAAASAGDDHIERRIYSDKDFEQNRAKAVRILEQKGYQVHDVDADDHWGKPVLEIEAYKNGREYDIIMSYPDLKIIKESRDY